MIAPVGKAVPLSCRWCCCGKGTQAERGTGPGDGATGWLALDCRGFDIHRPLQWGQEQHGQRLQPGKNALSQKMTKELYFWELAKTGKEKELRLGQLQSTISEFENQIDALTNRGVVRIEGEDFTVYPVPGGAPTEAFETLVAIWGSFSADLDKALVGDEEAYERVSENNLELLAAGQELVVKLEVAADAHLTRLKIIQSVFLVLGCVVFFISWRGSQRRLTRPLEALAPALRAMADGDLSGSQHASDVPDGVPLEVREISDALHDAIEKTAQRSDRLTPTRTLWPGSPMRCRRPAPS